MENSVDDTICAIATPVGEGGIGIIRVSGAQAVEVAAHVVRPRNRQPCHGLIRHGARLAQPGEFTKRAFLNGRLDLTQAEAVLDTIQATTSRSLQAAQSLLRGSLSKEIETFRERLIRVLAHVEAGMDFAEEDITFIQAAEVQQALTDTQRAVEQLIRSYEEGRLIREGIKVAIIGRPNVGKSSLLNALLKLDRAIVSDQPGTTRDVIDESLNIRGIPLRLLDTAGLRQTQDTIEGEGIRRTEDAIAEADVLLLVVDGAMGVTDEDRDVFETYCSRKYLLVMNKMDLPESRSFSPLLPESPLPPGEGKGEGVGLGEGPASLSPWWERARVRGKGEAPEFVKVSAKTGEGLDHLTSVIQSVCLKEGLEATPSVLVTRLRHKASLEQAHRSIEEAMRSLERKESGECVALDIRAALDALGEITGAVSAEDILDRIFQDFCIGK